MFIFMLYFIYICVYLKIAIFYYSENVVEECVRKVPEHAQTAEAILDFWM